MTEKERNEADPKKTNGDSPASEDSGDNQFSDKVEIIGRWKLNFKKNGAEKKAPEPASKGASNGNGSQKKKKTNSTKRKAAEEAVVEEKVTCSSKISPVIAKRSDCVIGVHGNGLDLVTFDLSRDQGELVKVGGHEKPINSLALICDEEHVVSGGQDNQMIIWRIERESEESGLTLGNINRVKFDAAILNLCVHPSNKMVLVWLEPNILKLRHINNVQTDEVSIDVQDSAIQCLSMNDDQIIYSTDKGHIYVWSYENTENPVFHFDSEVEGQTSVQVCGSKLAAWRSSSDEPHLWSLDTRQKLAELHMKEPPTFISLFETGNLLLVVNVANQLLLYQTQKSPPMEVRRDELARFTGTVLSLIHRAGSDEVFVILQSGAVIQLKIVCDLKSTDDEDADKSRKKSTSCNIL